MSMEEDKRIKFPDKHYVGFQERKASVNLGFMTPYGEDSAAKKRIDTVNRWAKSTLRTYDYETKTYIDESEIPPVILDNIPQSGFIVSNPVNHGSRWSNSSDKWRIEDPRGFELEITSGNLEKILELCSIKKGLIEESCIWARLGALNVLVPVNSSIYENALNNTQRSKSSVSIRDVDSGDKVLLQNGEEYIYVGYMHIINRTKYNDFVFNVSKNKLHIFEKSLGDFVAIASPKISAIYIKEKDIKDPESYVNSNLKNIYSHTYAWVCGVTTDPNIQVILDKKHVKTLDHTYSGYSYNLAEHKYGFTLDDSGKAKTYFSLSSSISHFREFLATETDRGISTENSEFSSYNSSWRYTVNKIPEYCHIIEASIMAGDRLLIKNKF